MYQLPVGTYGSSAYHAIKKKELGAGFMREHLV